MALISFARRLSDLAAADPDRPAVTCGEERLTRAELESAAARLARDLAARGVGVGDMVTIALPNSVDWCVACVAVWKLGGVPQPVSARLPARELGAIVDLAQSRVVLGVEPGTLPGRDCLPFGYRPPAELDDGPLPDAVSPAWKAPTSGGSTGRPKLIVSGDPGLIDPDVHATHLIRRDGCTVVPGPLYHNGPAIMACQSLLAGAHVALLPRFDAEGTLAAIEDHRAEVVYLVPTMMKRIIRLPDEVRLAYDMSSLQAVWHVAEPCPPWLKEAWIEWLGPERIFEIYAGTEGQAITVITGQEWLEHRGSVGRTIFGEIMVADLDGNPLPPGEKGEVWMRSGREEPTYRYVGAEARTLPGGWESLGDIGWFDADGYLYLADRMQDMILVGGANVYPAEVEAALQEHPAVRSCAVIGLPDAEKGSRVHAIVEADAALLDEDDLRAFLAERLATYKLPRTVELVDAPLRDEAGKVRRSALRAERLAAVDGVADGG
ncbi:MAG TPA: AMP-binding protein [Acidimicrobiales bacterium]|jgi:bile acid-coenzyme A ligase|nr:AMP-binding protein [Acidimicrobiales bacterium]